MSQFQVFGDAVISILILCIRESRIIHDKIFNSSSLSCMWDIAADLFLVFHRPWRLSRLGKRQKLASKDSVGYDMISTTVVYSWKLELESRSVEQVTSSAGKDDQIRC